MLRASFGDANRTHLFRVSEHFSKRVDFVFMRGLTFELSWHQRWGALGSKRKMGRRPSA